MKISEERLQADCFQWFWNTYPQYRRLLWAVPNGGWRNKKEAAKLKATGVVKGVHDLHLFFEGKFVTFELKVDDNEMTEEQMDFADKISNHGGTWFLIKTFEKFKKEVLKILD